MTLADRIRMFVDVEYVQPARARGEKVIRVRAGDVHRAMGLQSRMPAVCGALGTGKFEREFNVKRLAHEGPLQGANSVFILRVYA